MPNRQDYVDATNAALGVLGSKARGQNDDAESLLRAFTDDGTMASGFMLAAELLLEQLHRATGRPADQLIQNTALLVAARFPEP